MDKNDLKKYDMFGDIQTNLLPSEKLKEELYAIIKAEPELAKLTRKQPDEPEDIENNVRFALEKGETKIYPLIEIPGPWPGHAYVSRMPGYSTKIDLDTELDAIRDFGITVLINLIPDQDIADLYRVKGYAEAAKKRFGDQYINFEIMDYEPATDDDGFERTVDIASTALWKGQSILSHCGAGCGRTGMFLGCLLVKNGFSPVDAVKLYRKTRGCGPESQDQLAYISRYKKRVLG